MQGQREKGLHIRMLMYLLFDCAALLGMVTNERVGTEKGGTTSSPFFSSCCLLALHRRRGY